MIAVIVVMFLVIQVMRGLFGEDEGSDVAQETLISNFIARYAAQTGMVLARDQAESLIRSTIELHGPEIFETSSKEIEHKTARAAVARLCEEAELNAGRMRE